MKTFLKKDYRLFKYQQVFGATQNFLPTLLLDTDISDAQPIGNVMCTCYSADKVKSVETGKKYDHVWLWAQMQKLGKGQQRLWQFLLQNDGQYFRKDKLVLLLGYSSVHSMEVTINFPELVGKDLVEQSRIEGQTVYRTTMRAKIS